MTVLTLDALFVVCLVGAAAPLLLGFLPRLRLPSAVVEITAGVLIGPSVLGWVEPDEPVLVAGLLGLAVLLFLAGLEIDPGRAWKGPWRWFGEELLDLRVRAGDARFQFAIPLAL